MKRIVTLMLILAMAMSLAACGGGGEKETTSANAVDLNALYEHYEQTLPDMFVLQENTMLDFLGIEMSDCTQVVTAICADGLRADEVWLIEAKDDAALERIKALAETRLQAKADETISYTPDQYVIVQDAELIVEGKFLALLVSPEVDTMKADFEAAIR